MAAFWSEFIGTALMILFGGGVVANVVLEKSKGQQGGWIVITLGWAMAVFLGVYSAVHLGGQGHLNPAVSMALAHMGKLDLSLLPVYVSAQFAGAFTGAVLVWVVYQKHFEATANADLKMAIFCTAPAIENKTNNLLTEIIGTFVLVFGALCLSPAAATLRSLDGVTVSLWVLGIGLSLGGHTGYAINPARDLAPRIAHFLLPIPGKRDSGWSYSWIPIAGPIIGAHLAAFVYLLLTK